MLAHKNFVVISSILFLAACAAPYKLSDNTIAIRNKMSRAEALAIVHKQLRPSEPQSGVCAVSPRAGVSVTQGTTPSKLISTKDSTFTYSGVGARVRNSSVSGNVQGGSGQLATKYEFFDTQFTMDLTKVAYIGVEESSHFNEPVNELGKKRPSARFNDKGISRLSVLPCPAGQLVLLYAGAFEFPDYQGFVSSQGGIPSVWIHVASDKLDSLLAALSYLAPSATITPETLAW